jgi:hypothetical protein
MDGIGQNYDLGGAAAEAATRASFGGTAEAVPFPFFSPNRLVSHGPHKICQHTIRSRVQAGIFFGDR